MFDFGTDFIVRQMIINEKFEYNAARKITKDKIASDDKVLYSIKDSRGNTYDYISNLNNNSFYARIKKKSTFDDTHYLYYKINGVCLSDSSISLYIEKIIKTDLFNMVISEDGEKVYCKLQNSHYLMVSMISDDHIEEVVIDNTDKFYYEDFDELNSEQKKRLFDIFYKKNICYNVLEHKVYPLEKELKKDEWYVAGELFFQVKENYYHDMREMSSIPYRKLVIGDRIYNDSTMGLPKYRGIRKITRKELETIMNKIKNV